MPRRVVGDDDDRVYATADSTVEELVSTLEMLFMQAARYPLDKNDMYISAYHLHNVGHE